MAGTKKERAKRLNRIHFIFKGMNWKLVNLFCFHFQLQSTTLLNSTIANKIRVFYFRDWGFPGKVSIRCSINRGESSPVGPILVPSVPALKQGEPGCNLKLSSREIERLRHLKYQSNHLGVNKIYIHAASIAVSAWRHV